MSMKQVVMRGGNGKPVALPAQLADGLVKLKKATYFVEGGPVIAKKAALKPKAKKKETAPKTAPTYQTRAMTAEKPAPVSTAEKPKATLFSAPRPEPKPLSPVKPKLSDKDED